MRGAFEPKCLLGHPICVWLKDTIRNASAMSLFRYRHSAFATIGVLFSIVQSAACAHDGDIDPTFGAQGLYINRYAGDTSTYGQAVVVQSDGKVVIAGEAKTPSHACTAFSAARLTADASAIDATFGQSGTSQYCFGATLPAGISNEADVLYAMHASPDGGLLASGTVKYLTPDTTPLSVARPALMKQLPNGQLDSSFGNSGLVLLGTETQPSGRVNDAIQRSDGTIFAVGTGASKKSAMWILSSNGSVITEFDDAALNSAEPVSIAMQADGKIVIVGTYTNTVSASKDCFVSRFIFQAGLIVRDNAFATNGVATMGIDAGGDNTEYCPAIAIQRDGRILIGGQAEVSGSESYALLFRLTASGEIDQTFQGGEPLETYFSTTSYNAVAKILLGPDGKIYIAGFGEDADSFLHFGVIRLLRNGDYDLSFGNDPSNPATVTVAFDSVVGGRARAYAYDAAIFDEKLILGGWIFATPNSWYGLTRIDVSDAIFGDTFD
jgi:uncharacterized delta-60 repeat protein